MHHISIADQFCGGGGMSTGAARACADRKLIVRGTAVNHAELAILTHKSNHPTWRHLCASMDSVNPRELYREGELNILLTAPECTNRSRARGGKPINDQSRASAWCVLRWADALHPSVIILENVPEFLDWGPLNEHNRPIKERNGEIFRAWLRCFETLGYTVTWRVLCAADYGDPTSRQRLFIVGTKDQKAFPWPEPTHAKIPTGKLKPWRGFNTIRDYSLHGKNILTRKTPLARNTIRRIFIGVEKFVFQPMAEEAAGGAGAHGKAGAASGSRRSASPTPDATSRCFIVPQHQGGRPVHPNTDPVASITTTSRGIGLADPMLIHLRGQSGAKDWKKPVPTITAGGGHLAVADSFLLPREGIHRGNAPRHSSQPVNTVTTNGAGSLVDAALIETNHGNGKDRHGDSRRVRGTGQPLPTVSCRNGFGISQHFVIGTDHSGGNSSQTRGGHEPVSTITTKQKHAVIETSLEDPSFDERLRSFIAAYYGKSNALAMEDPLATATTRHRHGIVDPILRALPAGKIRKNPRTRTFSFLVKFNGTATTLDIEAPLGTVTTKDRFRLVDVLIAAYDEALRLKLPGIPILLGGRSCLLVILFRMLHWRELALAQGFPPDYQFAGNISEKVKQIGNAVPGGLAKALTESALTLLGKRGKVRAACPVARAAQPAVSPTAQSAGNRIRK